MDAASLKTGFIRCHSGGLHPPTGFQTFVAAPSRPVAPLAGMPDQQAAFAVRASAGLLGPFLALSSLLTSTGDCPMNINTTVACVALAITGLALIQKTRLRRAARNVFCRSIRSLRHKSKGYDRARDGK